MRSRFHAILRGFFRLLAMLPMAGVAMPTSSRLLADSSVGRAAVLDASHVAYIAAHCVRCHGPGKQESGVRLDDLPSQINTVAIGDRWQRVLNAVNSGDMPPADEPQPQPEAKASFLEALSQAMVVARKAIGDQGQTAALRRLNRREYINTIRDLVGIQIDASGLPDDATAGTFDTFGSSLFMSSEQIRRYLEIGRVTVQRAIAEAVLARHATPPMVTRRIEVEMPAREKVALGLRVAVGSHARYSKWKASGRPPKEFGFPDEENARFVGGAFEREGFYYAMLLSLPETHRGAYLGSATPKVGSVPVALPADAPPGDYILRVHAGMVDGASPERRFIEVTIDDSSSPAEESSRVIAVMETCGTIKAPTTVEIPLRVTTDGKRVFSLQERRPADEHVNNFAYQQARLANGCGPDPAIWVDWAELEGPQPSPNREARAIQLLRSICPVENEESARQIIATFAMRAFRGAEPSPDFIDRLMTIHRSRKDAGHGFLESLQEPLAIILASPGFLYLHEPAPQKPNEKGSAREHPPVDRRLTGIELASRLSYFLWASPPDEALVSAANAGSLADSQALSHHVDRMLADTRAFDFAKGFSHQWLSIDRLDFFRFNNNLYPAFDGSMRDATKQEVYHTFHTLLRENLDARRLLKNDFVVVNALLASYYGLTDEGEPIRGMEFRKVSLPPQSPRGGLLGMAAILAMGSNGERTSPVERGAWVLRKLLNDPPPPAPANVPQLSRLEGKVLSTPERLRLHQEEPQCAQCHRRIDPIGFALECFDTVGVWRTEENENKVEGYQVVTKHSWPLETAGALRDGTTFRDYLELRDRIADRGDTFVKGLVENLFQYAVGRPLSFADAATIADIVERSKASGYGLAGIVKEIVMTDEFRNK